MYSVLTWSRASTEPRYPVLKFSVAKWPRKSPNGAFIFSVYYHKTINYPLTNDAVPSWLSLLEMLVEKVQYQFIQNSAQFRTIMNPSLNRELHITTLSLTKLVCNENFVKSGHFSRSLNWKHFYNFGKIIYLRFLYTINSSYKEPHCIVKV